MYIIYFFLRAKGVLKIEKILNRACKMIIEFSISIKNVTYPLNYKVIYFFFKLTFHLYIISNLILLHIYKKLHIM